ncbi:MAG: hypothetical protein ACMUIU_10725 [bacterium]
MKKLIILFVFICCLAFAAYTFAATITLTLNSVPTDLGCSTTCECDQNWVVSDVVLTVTSTTASDGCGTNACSWEHGNNLFGPVYDPGILLNPGRLVLDLSDITGKITQIRVDLEDYCQAGCSSAAIYDGSTRVALKTSQSDGGPFNAAGWFIFDQSTIGNYTIDKFIVTSCNGHIGEIRITTTTSSQTSSTCISTGCGNTISTCIGCGGTMSTCWGCGGTMSTCTGGWGCGGTLSTCTGGWGCGGTMSTCTGGWGCGGTMSTCTGGWGCGGTMSTCTGGWGCGGTLSTCTGGWGCGGTLSTCTGGWGCGGTLSTCTGGWGCGSTLSTCSLGCGYTSTWCYSTSLYGTGTYTPGATPAF